MGKFNNRHQHWNEFQWEEEIRRDERRISGYFRELAGCLDLPDEEELIFGQLSSQPDLVPLAENPESLRDCFNSGDDEDEEGFEHNSPRRTVASSTVDELDMLCAEWNILTSGVLPGQIRYMALGCSCAFGKLLARTADFLEPGENSSAALIVSLGKRALRDLNETVELLADIAAVYPDFRERCSWLISRLGEIRERLISHLGTVN